jgi:hypothetical protein
MTSDALEKSPPPDGRSRQRHAIRIARGAPPLRVPQTKGAAHMHLFSSFIYLVHLLFHLHLASEHALFIVASVLDEGALSNLPWTNDRQDSQIFSTTSTLLLQQEVHYTSNFLFVIVLLLCQLFSLLVISLCFCFILFLF